MSYAWQDWTAGIGTVLFIFFAADAASIGSGIGAVLYSSLAAACAFYYGYRTSLRRGVQSAGGSGRDRRSLSSRESSLPSPPQIPPGAT